MAGTNLERISAFETSAFNESAPTDLVRFSVCQVLPSGRTMQLNLTQPSRCPYRKSFSASSRLMSDPGPEPIIAGRICGRLSADTFAAAQLAIAATMTQDNLVERISGCGVSARDRARTWN